VEVKLHAVLTSELDAGEVSCIFRATCHLENASSTDWIGRCLIPRTDWT